MELKRLELFGFKSFADRTRFEFDSGITVIVGPNGCGKSNVVDAVKWVLGEQSPKSLRGREMSDVIFAGSETRRSLGFAEATLVFDNSRGVLPIDLTEVEVSRRLYRSGESEYLLNRKPCRLRDIRELFMDTGIGVDAYSVIEQGKVDLLLQSNPQERRAIFDEAAGISKYKAKRREAERKLQRTEQNLLRLGDVLDEVERRLRSVKYQAGKARSYKEYTERLKELRLSHALAQYHEQATAIAAEQAQIEALQTERSAKAGALARLDQQRSELETDLMDLDQAVRQADARLGELRSALTTRDHDLGFHRARIEELSQSSDRQRRKIADLTAHRLEAEATVSAKKADQAALAQQAAQQELLVAAIEEELRGASDQLRELTAHTENAKAALMDLAQQRSQRSSRRASLDLRIDNLAAQMARLEARGREIAEALARLDAQDAELRTEEAALLEAIAQRRSRLEAARHEAETKQAELDHLGHALARAKERASALDSRRELLEDLQRRGEGIPQAVRQVTEAIRQRGNQGWRGMVADLVETDVAHAAVIESALGPAEKLIVADRLADVLALARDLEGKLPGQVRFLALDAVRPTADGRDLAPLAGAVGWAMEFVRVADDVRPAIAQLLARTVVVRSLEDAVELARGPLAGCRFVTLSGSVLEADGSVAVGPPGPETSLISRRSELKDIMAQRQTLEQQIAELDDQRGRALEELGALDVAQQALRQEIYEASMRKVEVESEQRRSAETRQALLAESPVVESERADLARQVGEAAAERDLLARQIADLEAQEADRQKSIAAQAGRQQQLAAQRDACEHRRTEARVRLAQLREKHAAAADQLAAAERDLAATCDGITQAQADLAQSRQRILESQRGMLRLQSEMADLFLQKQMVEAEVRRLSADRAERRQKIASLAEAARSIETEMDELQRCIHARELQRRELETKRQDLVQRVRDDFGVDLAERYASWQPHEVDCAAAAEEIRELQARIERLGAVNLEAIEEQEALEQRVAFLRQQKDDLVKARETLTGLIDRINRESRERFLKTFEAVRGHFQDLFRKLFGGGKADVYLENENDVLETGIEVVARPPGKQLQRISLLSGGEKTLAAVALLLAIFRTRPSPFAILDEVDAALDESNVGRFTDLVKEFLDHSQFVIISHNKRTMAIADVLYGVTMAEPGVSRKVSVRFSDLHERGYVATDEPAAQDAAAGAPADAPSDQRQEEARVPVEVRAAMSAAAGARAAREADGSEPVPEPAPLVSEVAPQSPSNSGGGPTT